MQTQTPEAPAAVEPKTYYSRKTNLTISPGGGGCPSKFKVMKGSIQEVDGTKQRLGEHIIQFVQIGQDKFGQYRTDDPLEIEFMDWRVANVGDVFGTEEYLRQSTPLEVRNAELERQLAQKNDLITELQRQGKFKDREAK